MSFCQSPSLDADQAFEAFCQHLFSLISDENFKDQVLKDLIQARNEVRLAVDELKLGKALIELQAELDKRQVSLDQQERALADKRAAINSQLLEAQALMDAATQKAAQIESQANETAVNQLKDVIQFKNKLETSFQEKCQELERERLSFAEQRGTFEAERAKFNQASQAFLNLVEA